MRERIKRGRLSVVLVIAVLSALVSGCSNADGEEDPLIPDTAPSDMIGEWGMEYSYKGTDTAATLVLNENGSFDYSDSGFSTYGKWGMDGDSFVMQFYLSSGEGSVFRGTVNADRTSISGTYDYFDDTTGQWSADR